MSLLICFMTFNYLDKKFTEVDDKVRWYFLKYTASWYNHLVSINHLAGINILFNDSYIMSHSPWLIRTSFRIFFRVCWGSCREVVELHMSHIHESLHEIDLATPSYTKGLRFTFTDAETDSADRISKHPNWQIGIRSHKA